MRLINNSSNLLLEVCTPTGHKMIVVRDIMCLKAESRGTVITVCDESRKEIKTCDLLITFETTLSQYGFFRLHRKHIINFSFVDTYNHNHIILTGNLRVPLSRYKVNDFKERLIQFNLDKR